MSGVPCPHFNTKTCRISQIAETSEQCLGNFFHVDSQTIHMLPLLALTTASLLLTPIQPRARSVQMGFFDSLASAFENDDTLGKSGPAGLKKQAVYHKITFKGPPPTKMFEQQKIVETQAIAGQKLKAVADAAGIPIRYSCMEGTCRICDVLVDGERVTACTACMPKRDCVIDFEPPRVKRSTSGVVAPTKSAAPKGLFSGVVTPTQVEEEEPAPKITTASLEERLRQEMAAKAANKKKGGWPF